MTADRILEALLTMLAAESGLARNHWRSMVGPVLLRPASEGWLSNWYVEPHGDRDVVARVEEAVRRLRLRHLRIHQDRPAAR